MADSWLDNSDEAIKRREDERDAWEKEHPEFAPDAGFKPPLPDKPAGPDTGPLGKVWNKIKSNYAVNSQVPGQEPPPPVGFQGSQDTETPSDPAAAAYLAKSPTGPPAAPVGPPGGRGGCCSLRSFASSIGSPPSATISRQQFRHIGSLSAKGALTGLLHITHVVIVVVIVGFLRWAPIAAHSWGSAFLRTIQGTQGCRGRHI